MNRLRTWEERESSPPAPVQAASRDEPLAPSLVQRGSSLQEVPGHLKTQYLSKVENSHTFSRSVQLRRLLKYLGERTLSDHTHPTETEVAVSVLHRNAQFDPQSDSLVRKEMSRLRAKLATYYAGEGSRDQVTIHSSRSYRFEFRWRASGGGDPIGDSRPCLLILPPTVETPENPSALFFDELMLCLGASTRYRLISRTSARWYAGQPSDVRQICGQSGADLLVETVLRCDDNALTALLWMVDGQSGNTCSSARIRVDSTESGTSSQWQELARLAAGWLEQNE